MQTMKRIHAELQPSRKPESQKLEARSRKPEEAKSQKSEARSAKPGARSAKPKAGSQSQKPEAKSQKPKAKASPKKKMQQKTCQKKIPLPLISGPGVSKTDLSIARFLP